MEKKTYIGQIVDEHTLYRDGTQRHSLPFNELIQLSNAILDANELPHSLTIQPLYINPFHLPQPYPVFELEEYLFNVECVSERTEEKMQDFMTARTAREQYYRMPESVCYFLLIDANDLDAFQIHLKSYIAQLTQWIPIMYQKMKKHWDLPQDALLVGDIVFEITCD